MDKRTLDLIVRIVDQYIESATPVGSVSLVEKYHLGYSSATIRNLMAALEEQGYMYQPHSSSGRIPTDMGYQVYVGCLQPARLSTRFEQDVIKILENAESDDVFLRSIAKTVSDYAHEVVFATLGDHVYFAGLPYLAEKPEFDDPSFRSTTIQLLDNLESIIDQVATKVSFEPQVWIGRENDFSPRCSAILMRFSYKKKEGIIGILGPMRMNYAYNKSLMDTLRNIIKRYGG